MSLPIVDFLIERMQEYDPTYELRKGTAFTSLFIQPQALIVQPFRDEANDIFTNQSLKRILALPAPNEYPEDAVDEIVENYYVFRKTGNKATGIARILYQNPKAINFSIGTLTFKNAAGLNYLNVASVVLTEQQMTSQSDGDFYYVDVAIEAEFEGVEYEIEANEIISVSDPDAVRVFNEFKLSGGVDRETNIDYINRAQRSIGERSLNTGKGQTAVFFENFSTQLTEIQPIGFQDPEMMRDIRFNYHIGGRIDTWVKTPQITEGSFDVLGLTIDGTRRLQTSNNIVMEGTELYNVGVQNLDVSENPVRAFSIDDSDRAGQVYSGINIGSGIDLSSGEFIGLSIDDGEYKNIKVSGANPSQTQPGEIVTRINAAIGRVVASIAVNPIVVSRRRTGNTPSAAQTFFRDPAEEVFKNIFPGDILTILVGTNSGSYVIDSVPSNNELVLETSIPNTQQEISYKISRIGTYIKVISPTKGILSKVSIGSPTVGSDGLPLLFGFVSSITPYVFTGKGEFEYIEGVHFNVELTEGNVQRIIGTTILPDTLTGFVDKNIFFEDATSDIFLNVEAGDVLTVLDATDATLEKDYKIKEKINNNRIRVDAFFSGTVSGITYRVTRTGIKDGQTVKFTFDYNPLSVDIGNKIQLDQYGRVLGIRPGREEETISDLAYLYTVSIELIDPVSGDPIGTVLEGKGGFGRGGYGRGGYGRGSFADWFHQVNKPELRFSIFEDSFLVITTAFLGQSFRVNYRYVPEIQAFQDLASSDSERILDGEVLLKHFIPAVVDLVVDYTTDPNNSSTPTKDEILTEVEKFIDTTKSDQPIDASDIVDVIYLMIDPNHERNVIVKQPITLEATIYNTDGSLTILSSGNRLEVPSEDIPQYTPRPLSGRTSHWIAGNIVLNETRITSSI